MKAKEKDNQKLKGLSLRAYNSVIALSNDKAVGDLARLISGSYTAWEKAKAQIKESIGYDGMNKREKLRASNNLAYLRKIVGVKARPTARRVQSHVATESGEKPDAVILPEIGRTQADRIRLIMQIVTALSERFGSTVQETKALIVKSLVDTAKK